MMLITDTKKSLTVSSLSVERNMDDVMVIVMVHILGILPQFS